MSVCVRERVWCVFVFLPVQKETKKERERESAFGNPIRREDGRWGAGEKRRSIAFFAFFFLSFFFDHTFLRHFSFIRHSLSLYSSPCSPTKKKKKKTKKRERERKKEEEEEEEKKG